MAESTLRKRIVKALRPLDAISVENGVGIGTPDVNCTLGWIELKQEDEWPKRGGPLRVPHYTPQQKLFAIRRERAGGKCWLLIQVGPELILLRGGDAARLLGSSTRDELLAVAVGHWSRVLDENELIECLKRS